MEKLKIKLEPSLNKKSNYALINADYAHKYNLLPGELIELTPYNIGLKVFTSDSYPEEHIGISKNTIDESGMKVGEKVSIKQIINEDIIHLLHKKMRSESLKEEELNLIFSAIDKNLMHPPQIAVLMSLFQVVGMSHSETTSMAKAILNTSRTLTIKRSPVVDKHSIGGIAGNRITPIMIPIIAASGLAIPKISTRAITSPAGTIDTAELYMPCDLTLSEMSEIVENTGGCIVSGKNVGIADVSDKIISVVKNIKIDPREFMIASILAKKIAAGSKYVLIDLPTGKTAKLIGRDEAHEVGSLFTSIGYSLKLKLDCIISPGDRPIGTMIGPALEAKDCLTILKNEGGSTDLRSKALSLAGIILESQNWCPRGYGYEYAQDVLTSGKAYEKFKEIVDKQGGDKNIRVDDLPTASEIVTINSESNGVIYGIDSGNITTLARQAGAPIDKTAGIKILVNRGDKIKKDDPLFEIHSTSSSRLSSAVELANRDFNPIHMEKMVLEVIRGPKEL